MIRMVALDVDGTLLDDNMVLSEANKGAIKRVRELGIPVLLCSARAPQSCFPIQKEYGGTDPIVTHNGAVVIGYDKEVHYLRTIERYSLEATIKLCRCLGVHYDINDINQVYVDTLEDWMEDVYKKYYVYPLKVADVLEVSGLKPVRVMLSGMSAQIEEAYHRLKKMQLRQISVMRSGTGFVDIRHNEATKLNGVKYIAARMGIRPEQILAIGNYYNDISLLRWAGKGVAVANSPAEVLHAADMVVASNNHDGVAEALERHVLL